MLEVTFPKEYIISRYLDLDAASHSSFLFTFTGETESLSALSPSRKGRDELWEPEDDLGVGIINNELLLSQCELPAVGSLMKNRRLSFTSP